MEDFEKSHLSDYEGLTDGIVLRFPALFVRKLLIISKLLVEAAGVEPDIGTENTQVTDTESA